VNPFSLATTFNVVTLAAPLDSRKSSILDLAADDAFLFLIVPLFFVSIPTANKDSKPKNLMELAVLFAFLLTDVPPFAALLLNAVLKL
jgi:hypothetical protein